MKHSYDSLKSELRELRKASQNSAYTDSVLVQAKVRNHRILEIKAKVLPELIQPNEIPSEEIRNAASRTPEGVRSPHSNFLI
jgi:hypothetical protein